ncbi:MAG: JAB domain-containing protein [Balneolaceae bacterium]|nr:MAG: JAB domain-containing protein [Balneolaceae bacterium]
MNFSKIIVRDMDPSDQPREKLMQHGSGILSDAELLAILLRTGSRRMNVIDTSRHLLDRFGGLGNLMRRTWQEMCELDGIGSVKAVTLEAAFELNRRIERGSHREKLSMRSPEEVVRFFGPMLRDLKREVFIVVFLSAARTMTGYRKISEGGATATIVEPSEVMRQAIMNDAQSIIVLHNHPSGNTVPSKADIALTRRLSDSGRFLGIKLDDHIIIAGDTYTSLKIDGYL